MSTNWNQQPDQNDPSQQAGYGSQPSADPYGQPSAGTYGSQPSADPYGQPSAGTYGSQPSADPYAQPSTPNYGYDQGQYAQQQYDPYAQQNPYQQNPYGYQQPYQPYGAVAVPGAPYGVDPRTGLPYSSKSKLAAGLLQIFLGGLGIGRFYTGHYGIAIAQIAVTLVTLGAGAIWPLIDGILMLTGEPKDSDGYPLRPN